MESKSSYEQVRKVWGAVSLEDDFRLHVGEETKCLFADHFSKSHEELRDILPPVFVEIGAGTEPFVAKTLEKLISTGVSPTVLLDDVRYDNDVAKLFVYSSIASTCLHSSVDLRGFSERYWDIQQETNKDYVESAVQILRDGLHQYMNIEMSERGLPHFSLPKEYSQATLCFSSLANYVDRRDLFSLISSSQLSSVAFVNGMSAGSSGYPFHAERIGSSLDISQHLKAEGYTLALSIFPYSDERIYVWYYDDNLDDEYPVLSSPILGQWWIRLPEDEDQKARVVQWIQQHKAVSLLKL